MQVERLREVHGICIDLFGAATYADLEEPTFLLTHMHSDHMNIPQHFPHVIHTLIPLGMIVPLFKNVRFIQCTEHQLYKSATTTFQLFRTHHTAYSCGILFPGERVLYIGDGRMCDVFLGQTERLFRTYPSVTAWTIVYDPIFEDFPFLQTVSPCALLTHVLTTRLPVLKCVHHGILFFLSQCSSLTFRPDRTLPALTKTILASLDLLDENSTLLLVGRNYTGKHVVASAMWHVIYRMDPRCIYQAGGCYRVFLSCHALPYEIRKWKERFRACTFERLLIYNERNMRKKPMPVDTHRVVCFAQHNGGVPVIQP